MNVIGGDVVVEVEVGIASKVDIEEINNTDVPLEVVKDPVFVEAAVVVEPNVVKGPEVV